MKDQKFIEAVQNFYAELGWGRFDVKENNGKELVVRIVRRSWKKVWNTEAIFAYE